MVKVILDTNFIIYCLKYNISFIDEIERICDFGYELAVPVQVLNEINKISEAKEAGFFDRGIAKLAFGLIENMIKEGKIEKLEIDGKDGDEAIINLSKKEKIILATMDRELKRSIGKIITIREGSHLELV